jgi:DNA (cytosine-5)-methyltransferase 1
LHFLKQFSPDVFVFENVPGLISAKKGIIYKNFITACYELGYHLDEMPHILNASDFKVLQNRERIILIGWKKENPLYYPEFPSDKSNKCVWDLLRDLPILQSGEGCDKLQPYRKVRPSSYLIETNIRNGSKGIRHHIAKTHNERDREIYRIAIKKWIDTEKRLNYNELPENLKTHKNRKVFKDRFKVVSGFSYSHSILAHLARDGHYFIHPDINQARSLTIREAARIQSFPDNYIFEGSRSSKYIQIGNAVPPLMAEGIAGKIKKMLQEM